MDKKEVLKDVLMLEEISREGDIEDVLVELELLRDENEIDHFIAVIVLLMSREVKDCPSCADKFKDILTAVEQVSAE